jgi:menaquinone-dependent protoporphyrinogen oxidase
MRVLVTFGSRRGGTEGVALAIARALEEAGLEATALSSREVKNIGNYDAAIVGGALYANRWPLRLRWFVARHAAELRRRPVWFFSSGPLDDSAERQEIPPTESVRKLMARVGARGHCTFGGRLAPDARGFPASAMARTRAGDWRNQEQIREWAIEVARALSSTGPLRPSRADEPAHPPM